MPEKRITVLLADDHLLAREGLRALLELERDIEIVGEAENGRQAVELALQLRPDVVVMDITMPVLNGMEATRQILHALPGTKVLVLSAHGDDAYVGIVIAIGASGYVAKEAAGRILPKAIRSVHEGKAFFSPVISKCIDNLNQMAHSSGALCKEANGARLCPQEIKVLRLVAGARSIKEIAQELHLSMETVEKLRQTLREKLNIPNHAGPWPYTIKPDP